MIALITGLRTGGVRLPARREQAHAAGPAVAWRGDGRADGGPAAVRDTVGRRGARCGHTAGPVRTPGLRAVAAGRAIGVRWESV